jgi:hypothetical protein
VIISPQSEAPAALERPHRFKIGKVTRQLFALLLLTVAGVYLFTPLLTALNRYRGRRLLNEAEACVSREKWQLASQALMEAARLMPDHPETLRFLAQFLEKTRSRPQLLRDCLLKLKQQGHSRPTDAIVLTRALLDMGEAQGALTAFGDLTAAERSSPTGQALEKDLLILQGRHDPTLYGLNPDVKELVSDLSASFPEIQLAARSKLWKLSEKSDSSALQALKFLSGLNTLTSQEADWLIQRIEAHPKSSLSDQLGAYLALLKAAPDRKPEIFKTLVGYFRNANQDEFRLFLQWLAFQGEADLLRSLISTDSLYQDPSLFAPYAESLANAKRWPQLIELLENPNTKPPVSQERLEIWLAEAWSQRQEDRTKVIYHLERAIDFASKTGNQEALLAVAKNAQTYRLFDIAIRSHLALAEKNPHSALPLLEMALEAAVQKGDTEEIYRLTRRLTDIQPNDHQRQTRLCYLRLLIGDRLETIQIQDPPEIQPTLQCLFRALAYYRTRNLAAMKTQLRLIETTDEFSSGQKAVYAGMLAASGQLSKAYQMAERLPLPLLLKEEKAMLKDVL